MEAREYLELLAIDDDPGRYDYLRVLLREREKAGGTPVRLVVVACRACVEHYLVHADAVLLDYDLDGGDLCAACGWWPDVAKGSGYVGHLSTAGIPVIVTSASHPENRMALAAALRDAGVRVDVLSASEFGCETRWMGRLWVWGVV